MAIAGNSNKELEKSSGKLLKNYEALLILPNTRTSRLVFYFLRVCLILLNFEDKILRRVLEILNPGITPKMKRT